MKDKSKQWWRWLLFIPAGIAFFLIASVLGKLINYLSTLGFLGFANGLLFSLSQIIVEVAMLYGSAKIAAIVAPDEKIGGIIYSSIMLLVMGISLAFGIMNGENWVFYVSTAGCIVAMILAIIQSTNEDLVN